MSVDLLLGQIERLTLEVTDLGQRTSDTRDTFAREKAVAIQRLLTGNREVRPDKKLVQRVIQLIDSVDSDTSLKEFRSQLAESHDIEESHGLVGQMLRTVGSFFSITNFQDSSFYSLKNRHESGRWRISENYLKRIDKDRFYEHIRKAPVTTLVVDRLYKPTLFYTGKSLERLVSDQVELSALAEGITICLDTGETVGMMGKALYSLCTKSDAPAPVIYTNSYRDFTFFPEAVTQISLNSFCDIVSKVTTGKFDAPVLLDVLLRVVVSHLPNDTFLNCRRVCKAWHRALQDGSAWADRVFPMNICSGPMPAHAMFFSPISYNPEGVEWQTMRHRIKDIVYLAKSGHVGAQIELAQRVFLNKGSYQIDTLIALDWIRQSTSAKSLYALGININIISYIRESAKMGYAPAQDRMGKVYQEDKQLPIDLKKAEKWYLRAALQGYVYAENNLGALYCLDANEDESLRWSLRAANKGHPEAQCRVGALLYKRAKNSDDVQVAITWLKRAGDQNFIEALYGLGMIYCDNVKLRNYKEAVRYFQMAANEQHGLAQYNLGIQYYYGRGVTRSAQEAANWYLLAAEQGICEAQYRLGKLYYEGDGVPEDFAEAFKWFLCAAEQEDRQAQFYVGIMYRDGNGVVANIDESCNWLTRAADNGHVESSFLLGNAYRRGVEVPENFDQACKRLSFAAKKGHREAQYCYGLMYSDGAREEKDHEEAAYWYQLSANKGYIRAQYKLGYIHQHGIGVVKDIKKAIMWYERAALDGIGSAKENRELEELIAELRSKV